MVNTNGNKDILWLVVKFLVLGWFQLIFEQCSLKIPSPHSGCESLCREAHSSEDNVPEGEPGFSFLEEKLGSRCANWDPALCALETQRQLLRLPGHP